MASIGITLAFLLLLQSVVSQTAPEQIHLSFGGSAGDTTIVITWSTLAKVNESVIQYGMCNVSPCPVSLLVSTATGSVQPFVDGGDAKRVQYIHRVGLRLKELVPTQNYAYRCGGNSSWSDVFTFKTPGDSTWAPRIAVFGDLGVDNAKIVPALTQQVQKGMYDVAIDVGDFAYDMADDNGKKGDQFMNLIQPFASLLPLMVCPGNHERHYNFSHYISRFSMPDRESTDNMYYSVNIGPVHLISISTEFYFFWEYYSTQWHVKRQYEWLKQDLIYANAAENRTARPWIIIFGHRPMYCSDSNSVPGDELSVDCTVRAQYLREGNASAPYGLESLLFTYKVDLAIFGHIHYYERSWPVYNFTVYNSTDAYVNAAAPVHIVNGAAGNYNGLRSFTGPLPFSAARIGDYSYGVVTAWNTTHLSLEQLVIQPGRGSNTAISDELWLRKDAPPTGDASRLGLVSFTLLFFCLSATLY